LTKLLGLDPRAKTHKGFALVQTGQPQRLRLEAMPSPNSKSDQRARVTVKLQSFQYKLEGICDMCAPLTDALIEATKHIRTSLLATAITWACNMLRACHETNSTLAPPLMLLPT
jgi:hypothetical protein